MFELDNGILKYIPKKYHEFIVSCYADDDGYWVICCNDYKFVATDCHTLHCATVKELKNDIKEGLEKVVNNG